MALISNAEPLDRIFHALSDANRRAMLDRLCEGPASGSEIGRPLRLGLPSVVKHLHVLDEAGLVSSKKVGRVRTYRIATKGFKSMETWVADRKRKLHAQFDRLETLLLEEDNP
jgi:DNA-binding transcriptional ArsR family regulator